MKRGGRVRLSISAAEQPSMKQGSIFLEGLLMGGRCPTGSETGLGWGSLQSKHSQG